MVEALGFLEWDAARARVGMRLLYSRAPKRQCPPDQQDATDRPFLFRKDLGILSTFCDPTETNIAR
jgi:hypothetical protein